jgi:hypothetical protein
MLVDRQVVNVPRCYRWVVLVVLPMMLLGSSCAYQSSRARMEYRARPLDPQPPAPVVSATTAEHDGEAARTAEAAADERR